MPFLFLSYIAGILDGADFTGAYIYGATIEPHAGHSVDLTGAINEPAPTPEPSTWMLLGTGLLGLLGYGWRQRRSTP
jgi:hypothetical protein